MNRIKGFYQVLFTVFFCLVLVVPAFSQINFTSQLLIQNFDGAHNAFCADMDNDQDIDIIACAMFDDQVVWMENEGNFNFEYHLVSDEANGVAIIEAGDMNNDGKMDIVGSELDGNRISIWFNEAGSESFEHFTVENNYSGVKGLRLADMDYDGDLDIVTGGYFASRISWWENVAEDGREWVEHSVSTAYNYNANVYAADLDDDGDMDVMATIAHAIKVFTNNGDDTFSNTHTFDGEESRCVKAADVNQDGYMDILGAAAGDDALYWWELSPNGTYTQHTIVSNWNGAVHLNATDIDQDGDIDILGAGYTAQQVAVFYNDGEENFLMDVVDSNYDWSKYIEAADLDGDGDLDMVSTALLQGEVRYYINNGDGINPNPRFSMESVIAAPGAVLTIPVYVENVEPVDSILAVALSINLPFENLSVVNVNPYEGSTIAGNTWNHAWYANPQGLQIYSSGNVPVSTSGIIYEIDVLMNDNLPIGESDPLIFDEVLLNDGTPDATSQNGEITYSSVLFGDVSENGVVQLLDAMMIMEYAVFGGNWSAERLIAGDVSGNGEISILDAALVLAYTLNNLTTFPVQGNSLDLSASTDLLIPESISLNNPQQIVLPITIFNPSNLRSLEIQCDYPVDILEAVEATVGEEECLFVVNNNEGGCEIYVCFPDVLEVNAINLNLVLDVTAPFSNFAFTIYQYRTNEDNAVNTTIYSDIINTTSVNQNSELPLTHGLVNVFPNPFNPQTTATVELTKNAYVKIDIFNTLGQRVATIANGQMQAGRSSYVWNAKNYPSGIYLMNVQVDNKSSIKKITLLK